MYEFATKSFATESVAIKINYNQQQHLVAFSFVAMKRNFNQQRLQTVMIKIKINCNQHRLQLILSCNHKRLQTKSFTIHWIAIEFLLLMSIDCNCYWLQFIWLQLSLLQHRLIADESVSIKERTIIQTKTFFKLLKPSSMKLKANKFPYSPINTGLVIFEYFA